MPWVPNTTDALMSLKVTGRTHHDTCTAGARASGT